MSRQTRSNTRSIRGPQSALTDFLASHNISANQIRLDADARRAAAQNQQAQGDRDGQQNGYSSPAAAATPSSTDGNRGSAAGQGRRRNEEQRAIEKIKASKKFRKRKRSLDDGDDDEEDDLALAIFQERSAPLPGQMENCEICEKRFTVTAYSRAGPNGGLLCTPCGKELDKDEPPKKKTPKRAEGGPIGRRRKIQSNILDGTYRLGPRSLIAMCLDTLTKNIELADELGELPPLVIDRIARRLSKSRLLDSRTLDLFLSQSAEDVYIYDGGRLTSDDLIRIFQTVSSLKNLKIRNAIQFKDEVMDYLLSREIKLESFYLHGSNLLSDKKWQEFLRKKGKFLASLRVYYTDKHFGDETLASLKTDCPSLRRLKVMHNQIVSSDGIKEIAKIRSLEHLSLDLHKHVHSDTYVHLLNNIGENLRTFSLLRTPELDNTVLDALHNTCRSLEKLRITDSEVMTDEGFARLFSEWKNPGLTFIDFQKCRHIDAARPRENPDNIGLSSNGFKALMAHSGRTLQNLNVHACRHISAAAFEEVFAADKIYPELTKLEISFCEEVTDFVVGSIFRSCPRLRELNVFGCMKVKDVRVPRGRILVGVPNAVGMVIEGDDNPETM